MKARRLASTLLLSALVGVAFGPLRVADAHHTEIGRWPGTWTPRRYNVPPPNQAFSRNYSVYVPSTRPAGTPEPLVVILHGCTQTAHDIALGSRFNDTAEAHGFVVAYPEQDTNPAGSIGGTSNGSGCWNLGRENGAGQVRAGEAATIAAITKEVMARENVDPRRVYLWGPSSGGAMAVVMGATYPELYAAIGVFAGCPYRACTDTTGLLAYQAMGDGARPMPVWVGQGTADPLGPAQEAVVEEWLGVADLADDGEMNGSVTREPEIDDSHAPDPSDVSPGGVGLKNCTLPFPTRRFPCTVPNAGFSEYPYTIRRYAGAGYQRLIEQWTIHGLSHNLPNGEPDAAFTDPYGPDINEPMYDFFLANPMPGEDPVVDTEPPTITMLSDSEDSVGSSGWYNAASSGTDGVLVHVAASDASGVSNITCMDAVGERVVLDTPEASGSFSLGDGSHAISCHATDGAGNTGAAGDSTAMPLVLRVDQTPPSASGGPVRPPDHAGWYNRPVDVAFTGEDATSGVESCTSGSYQGPDGPSVTAGGTCTDVAGNTGDSTASSAFDYDATPPTSQVTGVQDGAAYAMDSVPEAGCRTQDIVSGVGVPATLTVSGGNTNGAGAFVAGCSGARDVAGNAGGAIASTYVVKYAGVSGFLPPLANVTDTQEVPHNKKVTASFQLGSDEPDGFNTSRWLIERVLVDCETKQQIGDSQPAPATDPPGTIGYLAEEDRYSYRTHFRDVDAPSCWKLRVTLDDGPSPTSFDSPVLRLKGN